MPIIWLTFQWCKNLLFFHIHFFTFRVEMGGVYQEKLQFFSTLLVLDSFPWIHERGWHGGSNRRIHLYRSGGVVAQGSWREISGTSIRSVLDFLDPVFFQWWGVEIV